MYSTHCVHITCLVRVPVHEYSLYLWICILVDMCICVTAVRPLYDMHVRVTALHVSVRADHISPHGRTLFTQQLMQHPFSSASLLRKTLQLPNQMYLSSYHWLVSNSEKSNRSKYSAEQPPIKVWGVYQQWGDVAEIGEKIGKSGKLCQSGKLQIEKIANQAAR